MLTSIALYRALACSQLHQPSPAQGLGPDWLLSLPPTTRGPASGLLLLLLQTRLMTVYDHMTSVLEQSLRLFLPGALDEEELFIIEGSAALSSKNRRKLPRMEHW